MTHAQQITAAANEIASQVAPLYRMIGDDLLTRDRVTEIINDVAPGFERIIARHLGYRTDVPKTEGFYWARGPGAGMQWRVLVAVRAFKGGGLVCPQFQEDVTVLDLISMGWEFRGPIAPPAEDDSHE